MKGDLVLTLTVWFCLVILGAVLLLAVIGSSVLESRDPCEQDGVVTCQGNIP